MAVDLKKKIGPLPLGAWIVLGGGVIGLVYLYERNKKPKAAVEPTPVNEAPPLLGGEQGGGSSGQNTPPSPEVKPPAEEPHNIVSSGTGTGGLAGLAEGLHEYQEVGEALRALGLQAPAPNGGGAGPAGTKQNARTLNGVRGNPREGLTFRPTTYKGHAAHEYAHAVTGGVGPRKNLIILNPHKRTHAAQGNHAPAHAKDKGHGSAGHPAHPTAPRRHVAARQISAIEQRQARARAKKAKEAAAKAKREHAREAAEHAREAAAQRAAQSGGGGGGQSGPALQTQRRHRRRRR